MRHWIDEIVCRRSFAYRTARNGALDIKTNIFLIFILAIYHIDDVDESYVFKSSEEVLHLVTLILNALQRGRTALIVPRKKPIDELMKSRNMKALSPNLPEDLAISFYIQGHKLIFAAYQLTNVQGMNCQLVNLFQCNCWFLRFNPDKS